MVSHHRHTFAIENKNNMKIAEVTFDETNLEQQKAFDLVANTNTSLFITGKAGTGKTTFVKRIQQEIEKNFLVLAPTGIAALNVGGQTIHSVFRFPFEVVGPQTPMNVPPDNRIVLEKADTIIVDEASMVRADLVDGMDRFLCALTHSHLPFGGKQVVFVGDLFQLPPVYRKGSADDDMLRAMYGDGTPYFYKANVMKRMNLPKIEFQKVYRQKDQPFLSILDRMRLGENIQEDFDIINKQVSDDDKVGDYSVTLASHNETVDGINNTRLGELDTKEFCYEGEVEGEFKIKDAPVPLELKLKVGAQVIFCRNDNSKGVVNGTIAKVMELDEEHIKVVLEDGKELEVEKMVWESKKSVYNPITRKLESEVVGTFVQYPIKLAWAITIHKSQGMTFDRMHFDLKRGTFAPGQAYVDISRMRTLGGLTLSNKLYPHHILQNAEIKAFANSFNDVPMIDEELAFGQQFSDCFNKRDYDGAAKVCLKYTIEKIKKGDYRNAALMAKKMFDVMLDDECLMGSTEGIPLLKDCSMTCNFLNAVLCMYGNRYQEAIGYANLVLDRKACMEAMFIKARALYALEQYEDAFEMVTRIQEAAKNPDDPKVTDMKQYLFDMRLNLKMDLPVLNEGKRLIKLYPQFIPTYVMMRMDAVKSGLKIAVDEEEAENPLVSAFNDESMSDSDFEKVLADADKTSVNFKLFSRKVRKIEMED